MMLKNGFRFTAVSAVALLGGGCGLLIGYEDATLQPDAGAGGATTSTTSSSSSGGAGGSTGCEPGKAAPCYSGPEGTQGVGICKAGSKICNAEGTAYGACSGDVTPGVETCADSKDEDCDGHDCGIWAELFGDSDEQYADDVAVDVMGNIYVIGNFYGAIPFDGNTLISSGISSAFLAKFDSSGKHIWSKQFGGVGVIGIGTVAVDANSNVVIAGYSFSDVVDFGGGAVQPGAVIAKFASDGKHLWSKSFGGVQCNSIFEGASVVSSVAFTPKGDVIAAGGFCGAINFGNGPINAQAAGYPDGFVVKLRGSDGSAKTADDGWTKVFGDGDTQRATSVAVDGVGNVLVAGFFKGSMTIGPSPVTSAGGSDIFLAKLVATGGPSWIQTFGGQKDDFAYSLTITKLGGPVITGTFEGSVNFGGGVVQATGTHANGFVAQYATGKGFQWAKTFGGSGNVSDLDIAVDGAGNTYLSGSFVATIELGTGPLTAADSLDIFLAKLTSTGQTSWSRRFGNKEEQRATGVAIAQGDGSILVGAVRGTVDVGTDPLTSSGKSDGFIARFAP